jgi:hypothetical protein
LADVEVVEAGRQTIISAIARRDFAAQAARERDLMLSDPRPDLIEPMIGLREDEGQLNDAHLTQTQARPIAVGREMLVNQFGHAQLEQQRDNGR